MEKINLMALKELLSDEFEKHPIRLRGVAIEQNTLDSLNREKKGFEFGRACDIVSRFKGKDLLFKYRSDDDHIYYELYDLIDGRLLYADKTTRGIGLIGDFDLWFVTLDNLNLKYVGERYEPGSTLRSKYEYTQKESMFFCTIPLRASVLQGGV